MGKADLTSPVEELGGRALGEALLTPTKIYVKPMLALFKEVEVKGVSHITGGGFYENIPRSIPDGLGASIEKAAVKVLPIFNLIAKAGNVPEHDMFNTFNMGVGMSVIVAAEDAEKGSPGPQRRRRRTVYHRKDRKIRRQGDHMVKDTG